MINIRSKLAQRFLLTLGVTGVCAVVIWSTFCWQLEKSVMDFMPKFVQHFTGMSVEELQHQENHQDKIKAMFHRPDAKIIQK